MLSDVQLHFRCETNLCKSLSSSQRGYLVSPFTLLSRGSRAHYLREPCSLHSSQQRKARRGEAGVCPICSVGFLSQGSACGPPDCPGTCCADLNAGHLLLPPGAMGVRACSQLCLVSIRPRRQCPRLLFCPQLWNNLEGALSAGDTVRMARKILGS